MILLAALTLIACGEPRPIILGESRPPIVSFPYDGDEDGDGFKVSDFDCDDQDDSVNPEAEEVCNGKDDDCDTGTVEACEE